MKYSLPIFATLFDSWAFAHEAQHQGNDKNTPKSVNAVAVVKNNYDEINIEYAANILPLHAFKL